LWVLSLWPYYGLQQSNMSVFSVYLTLNHKRQSLKVHLWSTSCDKLPSCSLWWLCFEVEGQEHEVNLSRCRDINISRPSLKPHSHRRDWTELAVMWTGLYTERLSNCIGLGPYTAVVFVYVELCKLADLITLCAYGTRNSSLEVAPTTLATFFRLWPLAMNFDLFRLWPSNLLKVNGNNAGLVSGRAERGSVGHGLLVKWINKSGWVTWVMVNTMTHWPWPCIKRWLSQSNFKNNIWITFGIRPAKHATFYSDKFGDVHRSSLSSIQLRVAIYTCRLLVQQVCRWYNHNS